MTIMQNDNMVSINTILEMDLTGQVCSESIGPRQHSGSGGGFCFAYGALRSKGGRGILAFASRSKKGMPKIKPILTPGAVVTIPPELCGLHRHRVRRGPPAGLQRQGALRAADLHRPSRRPG